MARARRGMLKAIFGAAFAVTIAPFLSWGRFLYRQEAVKEQIRQKVANISELPPNTRINFPFPKTGDPKIDSDPFRQYMLIRTPAGEVRALSKVCVHLWCLWEYIPDLNECQCPCHGSVYNPDTGVAIRGPAYYQPYPTNALPMLKVEIDENGDIYVSQLDGKVGYGREWKRDLTRIQKIAESSPDTDAVAYVPLWNPVRASRAASILKKYNLKLVKAYGYLARGSAKEWLAVDTVEDAAKMDAVYALDVMAKPRDLLRLAEDKDVIMPLLRTPAGQR